MVLTARTLHETMGGEDKHRPFLPTSPPTRGRTRPSQSSSKMHERIGGPTTDSASDEPSGRALPKTEVVAICRTNRVPCGHLSGQSGLPYSTTSTTAIFRRDHQKSSTTKSEMLHRSRRRCPLRVLVLRPYAGSVSQGSQSFGKSIDYCCLLFESGAKIRDPGAGRFDGSDRRRTRRSNNDDR